MQFYLQDSGGAKYSVWDNIQSKSSYLCQM